MNKKGTREEKSKRKRNGIKGKVGIEEDKLVLGFKGEHKRSEDGSFLHPRFILCLIERNQWLKRWEERQETSNP